MGPWRGVFAAGFLAIAMAPLVLATSRTGTAAVGPAASSSTMPADPDVDPDLLAAIRSIRAIDDHAHPLKLTADGEEDEDWDALSYDEVGKDVVATIPQRIRPSNPEYIDVWRSLWKYPFDDASKDHVQWVLAAKARALEGRRHDEAHVVGELRRRRVDVQLGEQAMKVLDHTGEKPRRVRAALAQAADVERPRQGVDVHRPAEPRRDEPGAHRHTVRDHRLDADLVQRPRGVRVTMLALGRTTCCDASLRKRDASVWPCTSTWRSDPAHTSG